MRILELKTNYHDRWLSGLSRKRGGLEEALAEVLTPTRQENGYLFYDLHVLLKTAHT
jgi:quinol monooxygenase YgiN